MRNLSVMEQKQVVGGTYTYKFFATQDASDYGYGFGYSTYDEALRAMRRSLNYGVEYHAWIVNEDNNIREMDNYHYYR